MSIHSMRYRSLAFAVVAIALISLIGSSWAEAPIEPIPGVQILDANDFESTKPERFTNIRFVSNEYRLVLSSQNKLRVHDLTRNRRTMDVSAVSAATAAAGETAPNQSFAINVAKEEIAAILSRETQTIPLSNGKRSSFRAQVNPLHAISVDENGHRYVALDTSGNIFKGASSSTLVYSHTLEGQWQPGVLSSNGRFAGRLGRNNTAIATDLTTNRALYSASFGRSGSVSLHSISSIGQLILIREVKSGRDRECEAVFPTTKGALTLRIGSKSLGLADSGNWLVYSVDKQTLGIYELSTHTTALTWTCDPDAAFGCAISDDAKYVVSRNISSQQAFVWDIDHLLERRIRREMTLDLTWDALKDEGEVAFLAQRVLVMNGDAAVSFISEKISAAEQVDDVSTLMSQLGSDSYAKREAATAKLVDLFPWAEQSAIALALKSDDREVQERVKVMRSSDSATRAMNRASRCLSALRCIDSDRARAMCTKVTEVNASSAARLK